MKHKVEHAVKKLRLVTERILHQLEMRNPSLSTEFAVYHGIAFNAFKRLCDFNVALADDFAVAAEEGDLAILYLRDHAKPVIFVLEDPPGIIEWAIGQRGEHRLKTLR